MFIRVHLWLNSLATASALSFLKCPDAQDALSIFEAMTEIFEAPRDSFAADNSAEISAPLWASALATIALFAVFALAMLPTAKPGPADQLTLPVLGVFAALFAWTPLQRRVAPQREAATFALCAALFVAYGLARRTAPESLPSLQILGDDYRFSCAAYCVFLGAILSASAWRKSIGGWMRGLLGGMLILFIIGIFSFKFIGAYYPPASPQQIDPRVFVFFVMQSAEFAALALCCASVAAHPRTRTLMLIALPVLLMAVWARHHFAPAPLESEDD